MKEKGKAPVGRIGEEAVCGYLLNHGHTILERNWRYGHLEVDIISMAEDGLHFTEVKTRVAPVSANPMDNIDWKKQKNIAKAAEKYTMALARRQGSSMVRDSPEIWLDAASVVLDGEKCCIDYIPGAYYPLHV